MVDPVGSTLPCSAGDLHTFVHGDSSRNNGANLDDKMTCLTLLLDVANGMSYLHSTNGKRNRIVHRDLKPQNVLVTERASNPVAKVTDFGMSKVLDNEQMSCQMSRRLGTQGHRTLNTVAVLTWLRAMPESGLRWFC